MGIWLSTRKSSRYLPMCFWYLRYFIIEFCENSWTINVSNIYLKPGIEIKNHGLECNHKNLPASLDLSNAFESVIK